jgi:hypothetical protein
MWNKRFWQAVTERAVKTAAQSAIAALAAAGTGSLIGLDWVALAAMAGFGALTSVLTSIASGVATHGEPSLTKAEIITQPVTLGQ